MAEPPRYFFVHLQKTGGTTLLHRLRHHFGVSGVYPTSEDRGSRPVRAAINVGFLTDRFRARREEIRVITGHFPLCTADMLGVPFTMFTVLRDPVERTLSLLRSRRRIEPRFRGCELEEIYADVPLQDVIHNHMVKMLSLSREEMNWGPLTMPITFDEARLEVAKRNLEERIDIFGLQEHFGVFCPRLAARFDWDLGPPLFTNGTPHVPVTDELRERIASDNRMDVELYRFAEQLWEQRQAEQATG